MRRIWDGRGPTVVSEEMGIAEAKTWACLVAAPATDLGGDLDAAAFIDNPMSKISKVIQSFPVKFG